MTDVTYSIDEFVRETIQRGYAYSNQKKQVRDWCEKHSKDHYTEDDLQDCYRYLENRRIGLGYSCGKWHVGLNGHKSTKHYKSDVGNR